MNDIAGGIGGVIEGALAGRAVESLRDGQGQGGGVAEDTSPPEACANCGVVGSSPYCPSCGQKRHVHRTLSAIGHDLLHGVLHLDGKFWSTLPLLVFKPGQLTRRYIEGQRVKFVSPMAMFLFSVFAMFAVFQMVGLSVPSDLTGVKPDGLDAAVEARNATVESQLGEINEQLADEGLSAEERAQLEADRAELLASKERLNEVRDLPLLQNEVGDIPDRMSIATSEDKGFNANITGIEYLDSGIIKKWREQPELMLYKLQSNAYKFSWLLIPLSVPFVWLMFAWRRRFKAYDHAIFVTYSLSFMSLLFITMSIVAVSPLGAGWAFMIFALIAPLHVYKHLKNTYDLGRFSALWRFCALFLFINIVIVLFLQALLLLGAF